jgi:hypothetical protein
MTASPRNDQTSVIIVTRGDTTCETVGPKRKTKAIWRHQETTMTRRVGKVAVVKMIGMSKLCAQLRLPKKKKRDEKPNIAQTVVNKS